MSEQQSTSTNGAVEELKDTADHDVIEIETSGPEGDVLLEVDHVTLRFGGVVALNDVNFRSVAVRSSA